MNEAASPIDAIPSEPRAGFRLRLARVVLYLTVTTPVLVFPGIFFPFVTIRNIFFRIAVEIAFGLTLWSGIKRIPSLRGLRDPILKWLAVLLVAMSLAAVFGVSPWRSIFGDFERMGGVLAWLHLLGFYVLLRILMDARAWVRFFRMAIIIGDVVVIWGSASLALPLLGKASFSMRLLDGSSIGNPGLLAPYLLFIAGFAIYLLTGRDGVRWKTFYALSLIALLTGIIGSENRSTVLGIFSGAAAACVLILWVRGRRSLVFVGTATVVLATSTVLAVSSRLAHVNVRPNSLIARWPRTLNPKSNAIRTLEWKAAFLGFLDRPILGYGPENHQVIAAAHFDPRLYAAGGTGVFDRPHNAVLEILSSVGVLGFAAMLAVWIASFSVIRKGMRSGNLSTAAAATWTGLAVAYAVYLNFWFFDINSAMLWVAMLAWISTSVFGAIDLSAAPPKEYRTRRLLLVATEVLLAMTIWLQGVIPLKAARDLNLAVGPLGSVDEHLDAFYRVMNSSAPQSFHTTDLFSAYFGALTPLFPQARTNPFQFAQLDYALKRGFLEARQNIRRDPMNPRAYVGQARLSTAAMLFYGNRAYGRGAVKTLAYAVHLDPKQAEYRTMEARILTTLDDTARARTQLDSAVAYAPTFGGSYFELARLSQLEHDPISARRFLLEALQRGFVGSSRVYRNVIQSLQDRKEFRSAASLNESYVERRFGGIDAMAAADPNTTPDEKFLFGHLPVALLQISRSDLAERAATAFARAFPASESTSREFISDLRNGRGSLWLDRATLAISK